MARMLGRGVWYGVFCRCCNGPRTVKVEKLREKRRWQRELRDWWDDWDCPEDQLYDPPLSPSPGEH